MRLPYDALVPDGLKALGGVYGYVTRCGLEKSLVDLAYLRASQLNGCAYCIDMHTHDALAEGVSVEKLMLVSVWREAGDYFSPRERAALAWAGGWNVWRGDAMVVAIADGMGFDSSHCLITKKIKDI